ncbi:MAG: AMP-dependent synthetase/ligase [Nocardioidaceae bacterium]
MREFSTPPTYTVPDTGNLTDDVVRNARDRGDTVVLSRRVEGEWQDVTATEFLAEVTAAAKGLVASGVGPGDRVALISRTRYEWTLLDYAIWFAGAITVPIYETSSPEQIRWILEDSETSLAIVESATHQERVDVSRSELPELRTVLCLDDGDLDKLVAAGAGVADDEIETRRTSLGPASVATVIYTSGTTGPPKGCMLTHGNLMFELGVATDLLPELFEDEGSSTLLFLPLAHVFARIIQIGCIKMATRMGHSADVTNLVEDLGTFGPTFILAVPRVFERVFNSASQKAVADGRGRIFNQAASVAVSYSQAQDRSGPGPILRLRHALFDRLVYSKLRAALGGQTAYAISGGAPLGDRLAHFFRGIGVTVLEGYGLTETTAALTVNLPAAIKIGTVGKPLPGTSVRVADDGELLFKGGQVFPGYWHNDAATAASLDEDGWIHTGDVGEVDDEGFVRITGRKKEILVTAGGKNVAPAVLEDRIRAHVLVSQAMVVGEGKPFVGALVTLDAESLEVWKERHGKSGALTSLVSDADLLAEIQGAVDEANAAVSKAEAVRKFSVLAVDWTEETGELTPTLKLKRSLVMRRFYNEVESLYL